MDSILKIGKEMQSNLVIILESMTSQLSWLDITGHVLFENHC